MHLSGNLITDDTKTKIREYMMPRKRVRDMYEAILNQDDDEEKLKFKGGNIDMEAAIREKLQSSN